MTSTAPSAQAAPPVHDEPTHPCIRCGRPVGPGVGLCEECNPLGLRDVASTQVHGAVFLALALGVILLAVAARMAVAGIGPFSSQVDGVAPAAGGQGIAVTLTVTNHGTAAGQTTCRVTGADNRGGGPVAFLLRPQIAAGATLTFTQTTTQLSAASAPLVTECQNP